MLDPLGVGDGSRASLLLPFFILFLFLLVNLSSFLVLPVGAQQPESYIGYFTTACVAILLAIFSYVLLPRMVRTPSCRESTSVSVFRGFLWFTAAAFVFRGGWVAFGFLSSLCYQSSGPANSVQSLPLVTNCAVWKVSAGCKHTTPATAGFS